MSFVDNKTKTIVLRSVANRVHRNCDINNSIWNEITAEISKEYFKISPLKVKEIFFKEVLPSLETCNYGLNESLISSIRKLKKTSSSKMPGKKRELFKQPAPIVAVQPPPIPTEELVIENLLEDQNIEFMEVVTEREAMNLCPSSTDPLYFLVEVCNILEESLENFDEINESGPILTSTLKSPPKRVHSRKPQTGSQPLAVQEKPEAEIFKEKFGFCFADSDEECEEPKKCKTSEADSTTSSSPVHAQPATAPAVPLRTTIVFADSDEEEPMDSEVPFTQEIVTFEEGLEYCNLEYALKH